MLTRGWISQFAFETSLYKGLMPASDGSRKLPMCQRGPTGFGLLGFIGGFVGVAAY